MPCSQNKIPVGHPGLKKIPFMFLSYDQLLYIFSIAIILAIYNFFKNNDELLILIVYFCWSAGFKRYSNVVFNNKGNWTVVKYARDIFHLNNDVALVALNILVLGTFSFAIPYVIFNINSNASKIQKIDNASIFAKFVAKQRFFIVSMFVFYIIFNTLTSSYTMNAFQSGASVSTGISAYAQMFTLAIGGILVLTFLVYNNIDFQRELITKIIFTLFIALAAYLSYNPLSRFSFLSWSIAVVVMYFRKFSPTRKLPYYLVLLPIVAIVFSIAGNSRFGSNYTTSEGGGFKETIDLALERINSGEDENMLDGLMMVIQVYPEHLDYAYGMEHLEILARPIPRAWWPGKPVGSYHNKLGLNDNMGGMTVGISPSLYGSFYAEGNFVGVIIFGVLYGLLFQYLLKQTDRYESNFGYILRGVIMASTLALLRGGDLPGIVAVIGMTYWPLIFFNNRYQAYLRKYKAREKAIIMEILRAEESNLVRKKEAEDEELEELRQLQTEMEK